ncbi:MULTISPECIES: 1,4-dihydroxy-2-naphthoate polyprenyltransferase [unclassified Nocardia]|uniref:1,4-dihydroxy-2-naphthoate polyprenyltransferase n=1 Tax=unclassified Nocardia TaxID=2637762 RepID=UPI001CE3CE8F|nr:MULTISPECIES: 1,4-dihydroxy-2-naphthoate polyprenyltransferase [unclassified Nocardia]
MATAAQWLEGARPRTLPNAIAPVIAGTGAAAAYDAVNWPKAVLALFVSLALIIAVNFANDYSDGIRGTDEVRVGPVRLVGQKLAEPAHVRNAAFASMAVAAVLGLILAATTAWWLVLVGAACMAGAWFYTGGSKPYGYRGFGEVGVFVFFGLVAVLGTEYVQAEHLSWVGLGMAVGVGSFSCAVLVANNLRDIPTDSQSGKTTVAVKIGDSRTRTLYMTLVIVPFVITLALIAKTPWVLAGLVAAPLVLRASAPVRTGQGGPKLIPALKDTGLAMLAWALVTALALGFGS